jgi:uncharacterized membrane protein
MFATSHLHPMLVHFPIALILIGFLAELAFLVIKKEVCLTKKTFEKFSKVFLYYLDSLTGCTQLDS